MAKQDCIPKKDTDFLTQLKFLRDNAPAQKAVLNISDADLATLTADSTLFEGKLTTFNTADAVYSQTSTDKQATRTAVEGRERAIIRRLKTMCHLMCFQIGINTSEFIATAQLVFL
jgi:hypothetical protein